MCNSPQLPLFCVPLPLPHSLSFSLILDVYAVVEGLCIREMGRTW